MLISVRLDGGIDDFVGIIKGKIIGLDEIINIV